MSEVKVGDRVTCKLDHDEYSGVVVHLGEFGVVHMKRDDGERGSGQGGSWTVHASSLVHEGSLPAAGPGAESWWGFPTVEEWEPGAVVEIEATIRRSADRGWIVGCKEFTAEEVLSCTKVLSHTPPTMVVSLTATVAPDRLVEVVPGRWFSRPDIVDYAKRARVITPAPEPELPLPTAPGTRFWGSIMSGGRTYVGWIFVTVDAEEIRYVGQYQVNMWWLHKAEWVKALYPPVSPF